jgi:hypothetical protein
MFERDGGCGEEIAKHLDELQSRRDTVRVAAVGPVATLYKIFVPSRGWVSSLTGAYQGDGAKAVCFGWASAHRWLADHPSLAGMNPSVVKA